MRTKSLERPPETLISSRSASLLSEGYSPRVLPPLLGTVDLTSLFLLNVYWVTNVTPPGGGRSCQLHLLGDRRHALFYHLFARAGPTGRRLPLRRLDLQLDSSRAGAGMGVLRRSLRLAAGRALHRQCRRSLRLLLAGTQCLLARALLAARPRHLWRPPLHGDPLLSAHPHGAVCPQRRRHRDGSGYCAHRGSRGALARAWASFRHQLCRPVRLADHPGDRRRTWPSWAVWCSP